jgi:hypothetical protein
VQSTLRTGSSTFLSQEVLILQPATRWLEDQSGSISTSVLVITDGHHSMTSTTRTVSLSSYRPAANQHTAVLGSQTFE